MNIYTKIISAAIILAAGYLSVPTEEKTTPEEKQETFEKEISKVKVSKDTAPQTKRLLELPGKLNKTPERIIYHTGYTLSFNKEHNQPNWVAWELTAQETDGSLQRTNDFQPDPLIPSPHQVTTDDYKHSGYDRGHMVPAADMKWSGKAMSECFYMSNMCPQNRSLNRVH